ncbi:MAG TPA: DinB family protein [Candidatus Limnocylindria bacterium]
MSTGLTDTLVALLRSMREAERDVFGGLEPEVRDRPLREGDWSPKDHQAHLTAWKARQANRYAGARRGDEAPEMSDDEIQAINTEQQAARADWGWDAISQEADEVSEQLIREISATDADELARSERLIQGTFGNGPFHAMEHFGWVRQADIGADEARIGAYIDETQRIVDEGWLPDRDAATTAYNVACFQAVAGNLDAARPLLRRAFQLNPELATFAKQDSDLTPLQGELDSLAGTA